VCFGGTLAVGGGFDAFGLTWYRSLMDTTGTVWWARAFNGDTRDRQITVEGLCLQIE
jgi:hypothetical protein